MLNHYPEFAARLGLSTTLVKSAAPYVKRGSKLSGESGCQIDLLLQAENMMCLVEIKRQKSIGVEVIEEMEAKVATLGRKRILQRHCGRSGSHVAALFSRHNEAEIWYNAQYSA